MAIECITSANHMNQPSKQNQDKNEDEESSLVFDASFLKNQLQIPQQFIWPDEEKPCMNVKELDVPLIDLKNFLSGDPIAAMEASKIIGEACEKHGFFLVVNHGIDAKLIEHAHSYMNDFFEVPLSQKQRAQRKTGEPCGYASSFTGRFSSKLPWKETLSFQFSDEKNSPKIVKDYLCNTLGEDFEQFG
jgi:gibberellin 20-oxidase